MFEVSFYGRARDFRWEMHEPVSDGTIDCAHLTLAYASTMKHNSGKRVMRSGCSQFQLQGEKIASYREWDYGSRKSMASRTSQGSSRATAWNRPVRRQTRHDVFIALGVPFMGTVNNAPKSATADAVMNGI